MRVSIILKTEDGREMKVNVWNWAVLHHLVAHAGVLPDDRWASKRYNGGGSLDGAEVRRLADFLSDAVLPRLRAGERMFPTGEITAEPDDGTMYREESELWRNYSLHREVLERVIAFLRDAGGGVEVV